MDKEDTFFQQTNCDRCGAQLGARTMSWFTKECICMECSDKEREIKKCIIAEKGRGADLLYEGCGYIPQVTG